MTTTKSPTTFKVDTNHTVAVADSSAANSTAFQSETREVRVVCTVDAYVEFGSAPTAASSSLIVPAYTPEYFRVTPGTKVAFLRVGSVTGTARVTELTQLMKRFSIRGQDRYRDRRTDMPNDVLQLEDRTYLLMEEGSNLRLEQAVGTVFSGTPIPRLMRFDELVKLLKEKEKSSQQKVKNKERNKVLRKRVKNG